MKFDMFLFVFFAIATTASAEIAIAFNDSGLPAAKVVHREQWKASHPENTDERAALLTKTMLAQTNYSMVNREAVILASLCTLNSTNIVKSRINALAGMFGFSVPTNRTENPAAWWPIPEDGLQSFDYVSTSFNAWMGSTALTNPATGSEYGNRLLVHVSGFYPVSAYTCRIAATHPSFGETTLPVGRDTSTGAELVFSGTYPGIDFGANGVCESFPDLQSESFVNYVEGGDDTVYVNGQSPSQVSYTWWARFGLAAYITITHPSGFDTVNQPFITSTQSLTGELFRNGVGVASKTVHEAQPTLRISRNGSTDLSLKIEGGQLRIPYTLLSSPTVPAATWTRQETPLYTGEILSVPSSGIRFFELQTGFSAGVSTNPSTSAR